MNRPKDALLIVDVQLDFLPGGALAVPAGDEIIRGVARIATLFDTVVATQDFHPLRHVSFASSHPGRAPLDTVLVHGHPQVLWPDHCLAGTPGARLAPEVPESRLTMILRKGTRPDVDSYSGFREQLGPDGSRASTGLGAWLRARGIARVFVVGLARNFCVGATAIDAADEGLAVVVLDDLTRPVDPSQRGKTDEAWRRAGVLVAPSSSLEV